jgi:hypothetical protein
MMTVCHETQGRADGKERQHRWSLAFDLVGKQWRERRASLPALPVLSDGFDGQPEVLAQYFAEHYGMVAERPAVADPPDDGQPRR